MFITHLPGTISCRVQLFIAGQTLGPQTKRMHGDGAKDLPAGKRQCLAGEVWEVPDRTSKTLEVFCSYSYYSSISWQLCSPFSPILSLVTCRWHTESVCLGLCLCLAALGNPAGIQHRSGRCCSPLLSSYVVTSSPPRYRAVAGVSAAVVLGKLTACSKALPYGHTAGTFQEHLWEKVYFWLARAGARWQQKHMSKRNFLHEYYSMYFEFLPPPCPPLKLY